jgi:acyl carrier protein
MKKTMTDEQLFLEVDTAIRRVFRVNGLTIKPETTLIGDLGAESIDFLDLGCDLEKIVDAEIDFRKLFEAKRGAGQGTALDLTVQELINFLKLDLDSPSFDGPAAVQAVQ